MDRTFLSVPLSVWLVVVVLIALVLPLAWRVVKCLVSAYLCCPECHSSDVDERPTRYDESSQSQVYLLTCRACGTTYERAIPIAPTTITGGPI